MGALWLLVAASWAGIQPAREPLPAREVERPIVLPLGWTEVGFEGGESGLSLAARHGVARGLAVDAGLGPEVIRFGADVGLIWREPPALAWSLDLGWVQPRDGGLGRAEGALRIRRAFGPMRAELWGGTSVQRTRFAPVGGASLLAQLGPVWVDGQVERVGAAALAATVNAVAQLTRGVAIGTATRFADDETTWLLRASVWL